MALTVNTNVASLNAQRNLGTSSSNLQTSLERLSSGSRINSAKDDAAGLQISNRLTSQINGLGVAVKNANDGISIAQTAEGAMQESTSILQRMRDLALQSANGSNDAKDRESLNKEVVQLQEELDRISTTTSFGGQKLLNGDFGTKDFQVGSNANETISLTVGQMDTASLQGDVITTEASVGATFTSAFAAVTVDGAATITLGSNDPITVDLVQADDIDTTLAKINTAITDSGVTGLSAEKNGTDIVFTSSLAEGTTTTDASITVATTATGGITAGTQAGADIDEVSEPKSVNAIDITTQDGAQEAVQIIDGAIGMIDSQRADLGAIQNRFESTISNLQNISENVSAARSRIIDTDYAAESANMTKNQIMQQAGTAMLSQANQLPQAVLSLLG
ncbi:flagellin [Pseudomonas saliphila]|uniref:flagellin n=1 Tax=Pseudomonas saliphila TaxID=2586906 RepID=UPI00123B9B4E|nr:flagellin [Pseudomonas saliphila]